MRSIVFIAGAAVSALVLAGSFAHPSLAAAAESKTADQVIEMIDASIFHVDRQEGLNGYFATVTERYDSETTAGGEAKGQVRAEGELAVDAVEKTRTLTLKGGGERALGAFHPTCGPWTLDAVMQVESTLFSTPLAEQFPAEGFERFIARRSGGYALRLKPKEPIGSDPLPLKPVITSISIHTDANGLPRTGELGLDMQMMTSTAKLEFAFDEVDGKQRIKTIRNVIQMANLKVTPVLSFTFAEVEGMTLPGSVAFHVDTDELSPTMAKMIASTMTTQTFSAHRVVHATPPVPVEWSAVSAWYLRRMMGEAFPGDGIDALLPEPANPAKDRKVAGVRRRMYLAHGLRLAFDGEDRLAEVLIRVKPGNGFGAFAGDLGEGFAADSTKATVEAAFGAPETTKSSSKTTTVTYPAHAFDVIYEGKSAGDDAPLVALILRAQTKE